MTNFVIGAIVGFLICVWAVGTTPGSAFSSLWTKLEQVQAMSAAANQAYEAMNPPPQTEPYDRQLRVPAETRPEAAYR